MPSLLVSCYELKDLFKNFSRKGRWGTEESKSRNLFDLKVVDGKKPTTQHKTSPHGLDLERIWGSVRTHCSQMRKLRPRAGVWVEVQQSLEPLRQVRSGARATFRPRELGAALKVSALPAPSTSRPLLQVSVECTPVAPDRQLRQGPYQGAPGGLQVGVRKDRMTVASHAKPDGGKGSAPSGKHL